MASRGTDPKILDDEENRVYKTVDTIADAEVLVGKDALHHSLPDVSHSPNAKYIKLNPDGSFREMRVFENNKLMFEIGYHGEKSLAHNNIPILHIHYINGIEFKDHPPAMHLTEKQLEEFKKYFVKLDLGRIQK